MSDAYRQYPFHVSVVYTSPVQIGPANALYASKTDYRATMWGIPYDDLDRWRGPYPPEVFAAQFEKMAAWLAAGHCRTAGGCGQSATRSAQRSRTDLRFARAAAINFQSVANQARFILARDALAKPSKHA